MLVHDFLLESAQRTPGKTALVCGRERLTYHYEETMSISKEIGSKVMMAAFELLT